jgi:membrane protease YdiL (CAAX protease family)
VFSGLLIALLAANVWPLLLFNLPVPVAAAAEAAFLSLYVWWASGGGYPGSSRIARRAAFRSNALSLSQMAWGLAAALCFAIAVHSAIVVLFRLIPFPREAFRRGYDLSTIPTLQLKWIAIVISATSAGVCEETGFRGYMQQPIEQRHGARTAILISSIAFTVLHLNKSWATPAMVPIVFGAGALLGLLAWASGSLIPSIVGHVLMDVGLFAYWWTGVAGDFRARPISESGVDVAFLVSVAVLALSLASVLFAIAKLRRLRAAPISAAASRASGGRA